MDFRNRHVVVTGGTGALGTAVVETLIGAGAICHVPYLHEGEAQHFRLRDNPSVNLSKAGDLADEAVVSRVFEGLAPLWASIHIAGGFAFGALREADTA